MNQADINTAEIERHLVREVQNLYPKEHQALENWGRWSRDARGMRPKGYPSRCPSVPAHDRGEWEREGYGEPPKEVEPERLKAEDRRSERAEEDGYDERAAKNLDSALTAAILEARELEQRIHGPGGLPEYLVSVLRVAYSDTREVPEDQYHKLCNPPCQPTTFRERLEDCLIFVGRFV